MPSQEGLSFGVSDETTGSLDSVVATQPSSGFESDRVFAKSVAPGLMVWAETMAKGFKGIGGEKHRSLALWLKMPLPSTEPWFPEEPERTGVDFWSRTID